MGVTEEILDWPVTGQNSLIIGNPESNVALCTLWSQRDIIAKMIDASLYSIMGNLYSGGGINAIIRNILANPKIRFLVIYGADLSNSGEDVARFFEKGVKEGKIIDSNIKIELELGDAYEEVRKNVILIDMRKKSPDELKLKLAELNSKKLGIFGVPKVFPETKRVVSYIENEQTGFVVTGKTIAAAWLQVLDLVMKFGMEKPTEYENKQKELLNILAVVDDKDKKLPDYIGFTDEDIRKYIPSILTPFKPAKISYTYGQRLFTREDQINMSQVEAALEKLKKNHNTRRAIAFTWRAEDHTLTESPPCLTQVYWIIQHNKLFQTVTFRSHDMYEGWPMNLYAVREMQELIAENLGVECGPLTCVSNSAHIYENRWEDAKEILQKHLKVDHVTFDCDKRGVFHIGAEGDEMVVTHLTADGQKTGFEFRGRDVYLLLDEIIQSNLISRLDHAAYMGKELEKLWVCMKLNKPYVQDRQMQL